MDWKEGTEPSEGSASRKRRSREALRLTAHGVGKNELRAVRANSS